MLLVTYGLLLFQKGYLELNPSGFRDKSYRISIYLVTAGSIKISPSMVWTAFRFIIPWYCAWKEHDEFVQFTTYKSEACNTDTYVSLLLLHAVVRWKGLVDRVRVPCVMCRLPPGVEQGTKLGDVLCWDFALLVVMGCWLTGARPDSITARVPVHGRAEECLLVWRCWLKMQRSGYLFLLEWVGLQKTHNSHFQMEVRYQEHSWTLDSKTFGTYVNESRPKLWVIR